VLELTWWNAVKRFGRMFAIGALLWFYNVFFDDADPVQLFWQILLFIVAFIGVEFAWFYYWEKLRLIVREEVRRARTPEPTPEESRALAGRARK